MLWFLRIVCVVAILGGWWLFSASFSTSWVDHVGSTSLTCPSSGTPATDENMTADNEAWTGSPASLNDFQRAITRCADVGKDRSNIGLVALIIGVVGVLLTLLFDPAFKGNRVPKQYRL